MAKYELIYQYHAKLQTTQYERTNHVKNNNPIPLTHVNYLNFS